MSIADVVRQRNKSIYSVSFTSTFAIGLKPPRPLFCKDDAQLLFNDHQPVVQWSEAKFLVPVWGILSTMTLGFRTDPPGNTNNLASEDRPLGVF